MRPLAWTHRRPHLFAGWLIAAYLAVVTAMLGLGRPYPGDEARFIQTSRAFAHELSWHLLRHYEEMSTPLPFLYFAAWGRLLGFDLAAMRLGALVLGAVFLYLLFRLAREALPEPRSRAVVLLTLLANPYVATLCLFVYTDMMALIGVLLVARGTARRRPLAVAAGLAVGLLSRQYLIFLVPACVAYEGWLALTTARRRNALGMLAAIGAGVLPFLLLLAYWGQLTPRNQMREAYLDHHLRFQPASLWLYLGVLGIYLAPILCIYHRIMFRSVGLVLTAYGLAGLYWITPVRPSQAAIEAGYNTVGLFDRTLYAAGLPLFARDMAFHVGAALGILAILHIIRAAIRRPAQADGFPSPTRQHLLPWAFMILSFLVTQPMSYLRWEKYVLPILPLTAIALMSMATPPSAAREASSSIQ